MNVQEPGLRHAIGVEKHSRDTPLLPVLLAYKSSLQQSPLGEARLQGSRAEVLVETGWVGYHQIWQSWLGNRNTKAPIHRTITIHAALQGGGSSDTVSPAC